MQSIHTVHLKTTLYKHKWKLYTNGVRVIQTAHFKSTQYTHKCILYTIGVLCIQTVQWNLRSVQIDTLGVHCIHIDV